MKNVRDLLKMYYQLLENVLPILKNALKNDKYSYNL